MCVVCSAVLLNGGSSVRFRFITARLSTVQTTWDFMPCHCHLKRHQVTLIDLQLDTQNSYLFTYNTFIKILYVFQALPCSSSGGRRNCICAASGIVTLCR